MSPPSKTNPSLVAFNWHDGVLFGYHQGSGFRGEDIFDIKVALYKDPIHAAKRNLFRIRCIGVRRVATKCDLAALRDNAPAGNIVSGRHTAGALRLSLVRGFVEVQAREFRVQSARPSSKVQG